MPRAGETNNKRGEFVVLIEDLVNLTEDIAHKAEEVNAQFRHNKASSLIIYSVWEMYVDHTLLIAGTAINRIRVNLNEDSVLTVDTFKTQFETVSGLMKEFILLADNFIKMCENGDIANVENRMVWADQVQSYEKFHIKLMVLFNVILKDLDAETISVTPGSFFPVKSFRHIPPEEMI